MHAVPVVWSSQFSLCYAMVLFMYAAHIRMCSYVRCLRAPPYAYRMYRMYRMHGVSVCLQYVRCLRAPPYADRMYRMHACMGCTCIWNSTVFNCEPASHKPSCFCLEIGLLNDGPDVRQAQARLLAALRSGYSTCVVACTCSCLRTRSCGRCQVFNCLAPCTAVVVRKCLKSGAAVALAAHACMQGACQTSMQVYLSAVVLTLTHTHTCHARMYA